MDLLVQASFSHESAAIDCSHRPSPLLCSMCLLVWRHKLISLLFSWNIHIFCSNLFEISEGFFFEVLTVNKSSEWKCCWWGQKVCCHLLLLAMCFSAKCWSSLLSEWLVFSVQFSLWFQQEKYYHTTSFDSDIFLPFWAVSRRLAIFLVLFLNKAVLSFFLFI